MARSAIELDFFSMEKGSNGLPSAVKCSKFERRRSFRDIQGVISKMNPEVVKSVIENGCLGGNKRKSSGSIPSTPKETHTGSFHDLSDCDPTLRLSCGYNGKNDENPAPMTIFYNGIVAAFDVSPNQRKRAKTLGNILRPVTNEWLAQAQKILKVAEEILPESAEYSESNPYNLENLLDGDFPLKRRKSLQVFLKKRKESRGRDSS